MNYQTFLLGCISTIFAVQVLQAGSSKVNIAYDVYTPPNDKIEKLPPIIFLHGFLDSKKSWRYVAPPLSEKTGRTVYTLDARNHGKSAWTDEFSMDIMIEDLDNFLVEQNISEAILVGHSMGGRTVQAFALRQPDKVEKLIVEDMSTVNLSEVPDAAVGFLIRLLKRALTVIPPNSGEEEIIKALKDYFRKKIPKDFVPQRAFDVDLAPVSLEGGNFTWLANLDLLEEKAYAGALATNLTGIYEKDTLIIYGTKSFLQVHKDDKIREYFPKSEVLGVEGGTHLIHQQFPEDFVREIARFITGVITPSLQC